MVDLREIPPPLGGRTPLRLALVETHELQHAISHVRTPRVAATPRMPACLPARVLNGQLPYSGQHFCPCSIGVTLL
jgi:hypothetical protein